MKNLVWEYDSLPHALICGGTGVGKTYFLLTIIEALLRTNVDLYILDPKNADLADLGTVMENVYHTKDDMIDCVNAFYDGMVTRSEEMKLHPNYRTRKLKLSLIPSPKYFASGRWQATIRKYPACLPSMTIFFSWLNRAVLSFVVSISKNATYSSKIRNCGASPR